MSARYPRKRKKLIARSLALPLETEKGEWAGFWWTYLQLCRWESLNLD